MSSRSQNGLFLLLDFKKFLTKLVVAYFLLIKIVVFFPQMTRRSQHI
jgi:hypothetical protein